MESKNQFQMLVMEDEDSEKLWTAFRDTVTAEQLKPSQGLRRKKSPFGYQRKLSTLLRNEGQPNQMVIRKQ